MRTAGLLFVLSAVAAASVHAGSDDAVGTIAPVVVDKPTQVPVTAPVQAPETKAPETKAPETKAPETKEPETKEPETKAPETKAPETKAPETKEPETKAPETKEPITKPPTNGTECQVLENKDRTGYDLANTKGKFDSCKEACEKTRGCATWTWNNYQDGTCWLKSHVGELVDKEGVSATNCVLNVGCRYAPNTDWVGFDLKSVRGSVDTCYKHCLDTDNCVTFSWSDFNGGTCWLKSYGGKTVEKAGVTGYSCVIEKPTNVCRLYKDIDFVGMDIGSGKSDIPQQCCGLCNDFPGCTAYTWTDFNGGTCWFKKSVGHVIAKPGAVASSITPLWGPVCPFEYNVDFVGNDIGNKRAADAGVCCSLCKENKDCKAYSWSTFNGGTCWMKSGKGQAINAMGVISAALDGF